MSLMTSPRVITPHGGESPGKVQEERVVLVDVVVDVVVVVVGAVFPSIVPRK